MNHRLYLAASQVLLLGCLASAQQSATGYIERYATTRNKAQSAIVQITDRFVVGPAFAKYMPVAHQKSVSSNYREYTWAFKGDKLYEREIRDITEARPPGPVQSVCVFDGKEEYMMYGPPDATQRHEYTQASVGDKHLRGAPNLFSFFRKLQGEDLLEVLKGGTFEAKNLASTSSRADVVLSGRTKEGKVLEVQLAGSENFMPKRIRLFREVFGKPAILQAETTSFFHNDGVTLPASGILQLLALNGDLIWKRELTVASFSSVNEVRDGLFMLEFPPGTGVTYPGGKFEKVPYPRRIGTALFILSGAALLFVMGLLIKRLAAGRP